MSEFNDASHETFFSRVSGKRQHETRQQMRDSLHNFTIHATKKPLTDQGINTQ